MNQKTLSLQQPHIKSNKMNLQAEKIDLMQKILSIRKESIVQKIKAILEKEMIVAYTVQGDPLTKEQYNKRLAFAEKQIASGDYLTQEQIEEQSKNW